MKYLLLLVLIAGCGPSISTNIEKGINDRDIEKYTLGDYQKVTEFETTYGVRCVGYSKGFDSAALSCDWVGSKKK